MVFSCQNGHKFNLSEDVLGAMDLKSVETQNTLAQKDLKAFVGSRKDNNLPQKSMGYMEERWCQKCCELYNQAIKSSQNSQYHVIGGLYQPMLTLCCKQNKHIHTLSCTKQKALHLPCEHCKKNERQQERMEIKAQEEIKLQ